MKLIIQIPCLNEEGTLAGTVADIPREFEGIDEVEILVINDGSTDRTVEVAREAGVDYIVEFPRNRGLGYAFRAGFDACLKAGADIIVNTDGDNQYAGWDIAKLVKPVVEGKAEIVIGDRRTDTIEHFSFTKQALQKMGSRMISRLGNMNIPDVASGFRAYSRDAALQLSTFTDFDHTAEHVVEAGQKRFAVMSVTIDTNPKLRESRLFNNISTFVIRSGLISLRTYTQYKALKIFTLFGSLSYLAGVALGMRFVYYFLFTDQGNLHVQSVILAAILLLAGFQMFLTGIVADLIATNRSLLDDALKRIKSIELDRIQEKAGD
ncbi:TPA: glycosyl transferase [Candidatus Latescibacteria bacterium]|mgnify:CR=1 FL=1|nr:glycosyl transferase [Candidatus Latescibacterota bacterium]